MIASLKSNPENLSSETKLKLKERDFSGEVYKNFLPEVTSFLKEEEDLPLDCLPEEEEAVDLPPDFLPDQVCTLPSDRDEFPSLQQDGPDGR